MVEKPEDLPRQTQFLNAPEYVGGLHGPMAFDGVEIDALKNVFLDGLTKPLPIPPEDLV